MASVKLEFAQYGDFTSFDILRSQTPMSLASLPSPIATGLTKMFYEDFAVVSGARYYYRVVTHYLTESFLGVAGTENPNTLSVLIVLMSVNSSNRFVNLNEKSS